MCASDVIRIPVGTTLKDAEKRIIEATLRSTKGNVSQAARVLGIDRSTLYSKVGRHKLPREAGCQNIVEPGCGLRAQAARRVGKGR